MSDVDDPFDRLAALSLIWPSQRTLAAESGRYHGRRKLADVARIQDPATRMAVAAKAAKHADSNTPTHWLLIWETALAYAERPEMTAILPSLGAFFDTVAYRQRGTFMFRAIDTAATLAKGQLGTRRETAVLARGLCKTYSTASNNGWYSRTRDKLRGLTNALGKSSAPAIREAITAQKTWLKSAPKEERSTVLGRYCSAKDVALRLDELDGVATALER